MTLANPRAFEPLFNSLLAFQIERPDGSRRGSLMACILSEGLSEVFADDGTESKVWQISIVVRQADWNAAAHSVPQSGDRFTSPVTRKTYALKDAQLFADKWTIAAREVQP